MLHINKILFPTDYSLCAEHAFSHAAYLASQYTAELHLLHVVEIGGAAEYRLESLVLSDDEVAERFHQVTGKPRQQTPANGVCLVQAQVHGASPALAILNYVERHGIDLVVMGTHGRHGLDRLIMGSIAEAVVRRSPCPVLTVRGDGAAAPHRAIRTVLVPMDFSEHSEAALRYGHALAAAYDAHLEALHVVEEELLPLVYGLEAAAPPTKQVQGKAARMLNERIEAMGLGPVSATVVVGEPADDLLAYATTHEVDLIVIATHGRSGLAHLMLGSVAEQVVRKASCPVFTVKSFGRNLLRGKRRAARPSAKQGAL